MIMLNFLLLFFFSISSIQNNAISQSSWISKIDDIQEVRIYSDNYFAVSKYNIEDNTFISAHGGLYFIDDKGYYEVLEFNSIDSSRVGDTIYYSDFTFFNEVFDDGDEEVDVVYLIINNIKYLPNVGNYNDDGLNGSWLMSGIERRGEMRMRDVNRPRKTLKMLGGGRFQWIAYDTSKKGFYGTGGGTFTAVDGKYVENIEFFSRDSNTVGKSLGFNYQIKEGDWHHKGFSSKGDPKYEIWTKRKQ